MTIDDILNITNQLTNGNNQFTLLLHQMNSIGGKKYYDNLINQNVQLEYGIYAICDPSMNILYIGKGGTIQNNGRFKKQNLNGRLKASRGNFNSSYEYFKHIMNQNNFVTLLFLVIYSNNNYPPSYLEAISLHHYYLKNNCLPMLNNEF